MLKINDEHVNCIVEMTFWHKMSCTTVLTWRKSFRCIFSDLNSCEDIFTHVCYVSILPHCQFRLELVKFGMRMRIFIYYYFLNL